jgi:hypothetical protein
MLMTFRNGAGGESYILSLGSVEILYLFLGWCYITILSAVYLLSFSWAFSFSNLFTSNNSIFASVGMDCRIENKNYSFVVIAKK